MNKQTHVEKYIRMCVYEKKKCRLYYIRIIKKNQNVPIERKARQGQQSKPSPIFISYVNTKIRENNIMTQKKKTTNKHKERNRLIILQSLYEASKTHWKPSREWSNIIYILDKEKTNKNRWKLRKNIPIQSYDKKTWFRWRTQKSNNERK